MTTLMSSPNKAARMSQPASSARRPVETSHSAAPNPATSRPITVAAMAWTDRPIPRQAPPSSTHARRPLRSPRTTSHRAASPSTIPSASGL